MAIAYRTGVSGSDPNGALSLTIPSGVGGVEGGDLMVITLHISSSTAPFSLPSGWSYVPEGTPGVHSTGTSKAAAIYKIAAGTPGSASSDAGTSVNLAAGEVVKQSAVLTAWSGVDQTTPFNGDAVYAGVSGGLSTTHPVPSIVTTVDGCVILASASFKDSSVSSITAPSGYTARQSVVMTGTGRSHTAQASKDAASAGSYGGENWTTDAAPSIRSMWALAIAPEITTQTIRPASDITKTNVTDEAGGTTDLYTHIDETTLNVADYVKFIEGATYETKLTTASTPPSGSGLQVAYVLGLGDGATAAQWTTSLYQGATLIASWTDDITADATEVSHTLTSLEFDEISDWSDLRIRWVLTDVTA